MTEKEFTYHVLSIPNDIRFLEYRKKYGLTWLTNERKILLMKDMSTDHIISCINMLERADQQKTRAYQGLIKELQYRMEKLDNEN